jgi:tryptophan synthase, alpha subunit
MNAIEQKFKELRINGRKGFIPFVTAGDPTLEISLKIIKTLADAGADIIELGVPFSDPMADGPTIQRSSQRALKNGTNLLQILELVRNLRKSSDVPVVLFSYLNPLLRFGIEKLCGQAASVGLDGVLVTDVVEDEAKEIGDVLAGKDMDLISLVAPTTTDERLANIGSTARGFIYAVSRAGVTGARADTSSEAEKLVSRVRKFTDLPVAVGFGISTAEQVKDVWRYADAAVVGSAIVAEIERFADAADLPNRIGSFVDAIIPQFAKATDET